MPDDRALNVQYRLGSGVTSCRVEMSGGSMFRRQRKERSSVNAQTDRPQDSPSTDEIAVHALNTPAQFHGRPQMAQALTDELRQLL